MKKKVGLVINPVAGVGGPVGLKGSDGDQIQKLAEEMGAVRCAEERTRLALSHVMPLKDSLIMYAASGEMGYNLAISMGFETVEIGPVHQPTLPSDTEAVCKVMAELPVDLLLFSGGDGTARNVCQSVPETLPVVGVPSGVKIHSAVYATSPTAAGKVLSAGLTRSLQLLKAEVMDIDEEAYRMGRLSARLYGYLSVPVLRGAMQNPKAASHMSQYDTAGICLEIEERISHENNPDTIYIFGAGGTVSAIEEHLGLSATLLGIDVMKNKELILKDANEKQLIKLAQKYDCRLIITAIGGQGHIFGRGNQQLSPEVIRHIGQENIWIVATSSKIFALLDQMLFVDTGDEQLDNDLRGYCKVIVGWHDTLICQIR